MSEPLIASAAQAAGQAIVQATLQAATQTAVPVTQAVAQTAAQTVTAAVDPAVASGTVPSAAPALLASLYESVTMSGTLAQRAEFMLHKEWGWIASCVYIGIAIAGIIALIVALGVVLIYVERKVAGHFQCRVGPTRVGPFGMLQTVADTVKLMVKEDISPTEADRLMHLFAPFLALIATVLVLIVIPYSPMMQVVDINIGVLFATAVSGYGVMGILLGGWSSNNKWSLIGAMRAGAQIVSYEVSATLAMLVVVLFSQTMSLTGIVESQAAGWWVWRAHGVGIVAFLIYIIAATAEINRTPFDISEGESELTGGFHTEYSGLRFSFFFLSEFVNMFGVSALAVTLFLGGWMPFHIGGPNPFNTLMDLIPPVFWFTAKTCFILFVIMWFRWTFPRLRVDQLMRLEWKILLPVGFVNLFLAAIVVLSRLYFFPGA